MSAHMVGAGDPPAVHPLKGTPVFTAPVLPLLNTLANASVFTGTVSQDLKWNLANIRIRVDGDVLDATGTTSFILGQGRTAGTGTGASWEAFVNPAHLKPVLAALKRATGTATVELPRTGPLLFTIGGESFEIAVQEGTFPDVDKLFPEHTDQPAVPGFSSFNPADLGRLGKLQDYTNIIPKKRRVQYLPPSTPLTIGMAPSPDKPAVGSFGPDFRILIGARRGIVMPEEQAAAGGADWRFGATRSK